MEGIEKPHVDKYKEITNNWNYDASCTLTSLPVWDLENFKCLIFVVQSVPPASKISNFSFCICGFRTIFSVNSDYFQK
jgi:hypothetical protein